MKKEKLRPGIPGASFSPGYYLRSQVRCSSADNWCHSSVLRCNGHYLIGEYQSCYVLIRNVLCELAISRGHEFIAHLENFGDDILSSGQIREDELAIRGGVSGRDDRSCWLLQVNSPVGEAGFVVIHGAVSIRIIEGHAFDGEFGCNYNGRNCHIGGSLNNWCCCHISGRGDKDVEQAAKYLL